MDREKVYPGVFYPFFIKTSAVFCILHNLYLPLIFKWIRHRSTFKIKLDYEKFTFGVHSKKERRFFFIVAAWANTYWVMKTPYTWIHFGSKAVLLDVTHSPTCIVHCREILNKMPLFLGIALHLCCLVTVFYSVSNSHLQLEAEILRRGKLFWNSFTAYPNPSKTLEDMCTCRGSGPLYLSYIFQSSSPPSIVSVRIILFFCSSRTL